MSYSLPRSLGRSVGEPQILAVMAPYEKHLSYFT